MKKIGIFCLTVCLSMGYASAQFPIEMMMKSIENRTSFDMEKDMWNALWIAAPDAHANEYGVFYFRKEVNLSAQPTQFKVHVTGDTRYKLYVNDAFVSMGPARSDSKHWNYETLDLAPFLRVGKNVIAAQVWNEGKFNPVPNASIRTGFLMMGEDEAKVVNTNDSWKVIQDSSYSPIRQRVMGYYALGAGEEIDMHKHIADWRDLDADLSKWVDAKPFDLGTPHDVSSGTGVYMTHLLQPSTLPQMERTTQRLATVRRNGGLKLPKEFPAKPCDVIVPSGKQVDILLDQAQLTNAFFHLRFSKGADAKITITYAESLYSDIKKQTKGNRNEVEGKHIIGRTDELCSNGQSNQMYTTLDWRTYRYVNLHIETQQDALVLNDIYGTFMGYPFVLKASLKTSDAELQKMFEVGWHTARLCAIETYTDCPYYEQLQYLGDTRIQALVSLYNSGDDRLVKNFLRQADLSRNAEGITMGRAPSELPQYITPYALSYIYAVHDYMRYGSDKALVDELIPGAEQILHYFAKYQQADGRIKGLPGWNFSDWVEGWPLGVMKVGHDGCSILMDLQLLLAYQLMTDLEQQRGNDFMAKQYTAQAVQLSQAVKDSYWDDSRGLFANNVDKKSFSQHGNALALICGLVQGEEAQQVAQRLLDDSTLDPCSVYYKFYLHQALIKAGLGNHYLQWLDKWRENLTMGLTTWGEMSDVETTRSDCHAWGASPNIEFFRTLLGIDSDAPQFTKVKIEPHLCTLTQIGGTMPHPQGEIKVNYTLKGQKWQIEIVLPTSVEGSLIWQNKSYDLHGGLNQFTINI